MTLRAALLLALGCLGCTPETPSGPELARLQQHSVRGPIPVDRTNVYVEDANAALFGEELFFEPRLSENGAVSCATCHRPEHGFAEDAVVSTGIGTTTRHTPSVLNIAWNRWFFWDGHADSAWAQALKPLESANEHNFNRLAVVHLISSDTSLRADYEQAFGTLPDVSDLSRFPSHARPMSDTENPEHIAWTNMDAEDQHRVNTVFANVGKALASYQQTLNRIDAPFDQYVRALEDGDPNAEEILGVDATQGMELFFGEANCFLCHSGPAFTNLQFHNLGLTPAPWVDPGDRGRYDGIPIVETDPFNGGGLYSDDPEFGAEKVAYISLSAERLGQFKTPSLRNVALTPPYMHSGQLATLEDVVSFYNDANQEPLIGHRDELIVPLGLTTEEQAAMVAFLKSLTGEE